ncbi:recombinase family protein [Micromonospora chalcea]|uniref:recombinase family protein n=1 Tax=Micromonospora chalcea TaxID=1874 RepID=UPI003D7493F3
MVRRKARSGNQGRFDSKDALLAGSSDVRALRYQRSSQDKKEQGKSVHDQGLLNLAEITKRSWTDAGSFTDNHRSASRRATKEREQFELLIEQIRAGKGDVLVAWRSPARKATSPCREDPRHVPRGRPQLLARRRGAV